MQVAVCGAASNKKRLTIHHAERSRRGHADRPRDKRARSCPPLELLINRPLISRVTSKHVSGYARRKSIDTLRTQSVHKEPSEPYPTTRQPPWSTVSPDCLVGTCVLNIPTCVSTSVFKAATHTHTHTHTHTQRLL